MSGDWEDYRIKTAGGLCRGLVYHEASSGNLHVRFPLGDYAARVDFFTPDELARFLKRRRWHLEPAQHFA